MNVEKKKIPTHLEIFFEIKPKIEHGISVLTLTVTKGPLKDRIAILASFLANFLAMIFTLYYAISLFDGQLTFKFVICLLYFVGNFQVLCRSISCYGKRDNLMQILQWIQSLHEEEDADGETQRIVGENFIKFGKIWLFAYKFFTFILYTALGLINLTNILSGEKAMLYSLPFISSNHPYYVQLVLVLQSLAIGLAGYTVVHADLTCFYFGLEIIANLDILKQMLVSREKSIEVEQNFLKSIAKKHFNLIANINNFNEAISVLTFMHFITSTLILLLDFTFVRVDNDNPIGYLQIIVVWGELFLLCLFGEFIKIKTEDLSETFYLTNWYDLSPKDQKIFLIILGMMQRSSGLKAAGMYDINIYAFIQMSKIAITYCALLYSLSN